MKGEVVMDRLLVLKAPSCTFVHTKSKYLRYISRGGELNE